MENAHRDLNGRGYRLTDTLTRLEIFLRKNCGAADDRLPRAGDCAIKVAVNLCFRKVPVIFDAFFIGSLGAFRNQPGLGR
jgi:hypothetical protein